MECRLGCGACCIAPSINGGIPGMPEGKPAGERCIHLDDQNLCRLFGMPERPDFCAAFKPLVDVCGTDREQAMQTLTWLEGETQPDNNG